MQMQLVCIVAFLLAAQCGTLGSCAVFVIITTHIIISAPATAQGLLATIALSLSSRLGWPCAGFQIKTLLLTNIQGGVGCFFENIFVFL